ncbi:MAG TPA: PepSY-like domain-containing protein [Cytophagaceae bacterium]
MKKIIFSLLILVSINVVDASTLSPDKDKNIPAAVVSYIKTHYPNATHIHWKKSKTNMYEADFLVDGKEILVDIFANGEWIETETEITSKDLPQIVLAKLGDSKIIFAAKVDNFQGEELYVAEVKQNKKLYDITFDHQGNEIERHSID